MARNSVILILAWTVLLLPGLCSGGWLLHPCECGSTIACDHESDCASDPCEIGIARTDSDSELNSEGASFTAYVPVAAQDLTNTLASGLGQRRPSASAPFAQDGLPFPPSDLPLLI